MAATATPVTFPTAEPIWCAGCGHFGVESALRHALSALDVPRSDTLILAGIGCSGSIQNNIDTYGYHALHGRVLPTATGALLANPNLTVIAAGGDGDGYAIGMGHLVHTFKRNPSLLYLVMNNGTYGLTKGQASPTASLGTLEATDQPLDAVTIGLAIAGSTFIARGFARWPSHLNEIVTRGLAHAISGNGFAFVEVMSPCVTYNDTYPDWSRAMLDASEIAGYDPSDRAAALSLCINAAAEGRIPAGVLLETENVSFESRWSSNNDDPPANSRPLTSDEDLAIEQLMMSYTV